MAVFAQRAYVSRTATIGATAIQLNSANFAFAQAQLDAAKSIVLQPFNADLRYRQTGTDATADVNSSFGLQDALITIDHNRTINNLSFIRAAGTDVELLVTLFRDSAQLAFLPSHLAKLQLWLSADVGVFQESTFVTPSGNGDVVGGWRDQSVNGNDATQATTANKPLLETNAINGLPLVSFDGTDDFFDLASNIVSDTYTIFIVNAIDNLVGNSGYLGHSSSTPFFRKITTNTLTDYRDDAATNQAISHTNFTVSPGLGIFHIIGFDYRPAQVTRFIDGGQDGQVLTGGLEECPR